MIDLTEFGLAVGHASDHDGATGLTVVRGIEAPFRAAAAVVGRATGTREMHVASPDHVVGRVDALLLTGGSAYGLDAAAGVMRWMEARRRGFRVGSGVVPLVPAAVLFDLMPLGRFDARPTPEMAYAACDAASPICDEGSIGAGTGATVGKALGPSHAMKGGIGAAIVRGGVHRVAAIAAVNAFGDVRDAEGRIIAGARAGNGFGDAQSIAVEATPSIDERTEGIGANTTLCIVAVDAPIGRVALAQVASAATAAIYRRITPSGTTFDGDVVFAICPMPTGPTVEHPMRALQAEVLAVQALEQAIERGVRTATGRDGIPGLADP